MPKHALPEHQFTAHRKWSLIGAIIRTLPAILLIGGFFIFLGYASHFGAPPQTAGYTRAP